MRERTFRTISASVVLAGLGIAGFIQIGNNGTSALAEINAADTSTTASPETSIPEETSTNEPPPFIYRVGILSGITTDNFWAFYGDEPSAWNAYVLGPTKPALFAEDATGTLEPELAATETAPTFDKDGWRVRVDLNPDLEWSDGTPITAHDVVFTFETVRALGLGGSWAKAFPESVESVHADDDHHVRIEFKERPRLSDWPHGVGSAPVMPRHIWEAKVEGSSAEELYEVDGAADVGGGPLALSSVADDLIVSSRNPGYPLADAPDTVEYHVFPDETAVVAALVDGSIDSTISPGGLAGPSIEGLDSNPDIEIVNNPGNAIRYLGFNLHRDPMTDRAFRTALALLLDRDGLADSIAGSGDPAWSVVPSANSAWYDAESAANNAARFGGPLAERLEKALAGLTEAGYAWTKSPEVENGEVVAGEGLTIDGRPPQPLTILTPGDAYDPARPDYVREMADTLSLFGFDARPVETDFDTVVDLAFTPGEDGQLHYDMYVLGWTLGDPTLPGYYGALFAGNGPLNNTGYESDDFTTALQAYERAFTTDQAFSALWEMERILAIDLPYLPLYTSEIAEAYRADRVGFGHEIGLGGLQARLGGIAEVRPAD